MLTDLVSPRILGDGDKRSASSPNVTVMTGRRALTCWDDGTE